MNVLKHVCTLEMNDSPLTTSEHVRKGKRRETLQPLELFLSVLLEVGRFFVRGSQLIG